MAFDVWKWLREFFGGATLVAEIADKGIDQTINDSINAEMNAARNNTISGTVFQTPEDFANSIAGRQVDWESAARGAEKIEQNIDGFGHFLNKIPFIGPYMALPIGFAQASVQGDYSMLAEGTGYLIIDYAAGKVIGWFVATPVGSKVVTGAKKTFKFITKPGQKLLELIFKEYGDDVVIELSEQAARELAEELGEEGFKKYAQKYGLKIMNPQTVANGIDNAANVGSALKSDFYHDAAKWIPEEYLNSGKVFPIKNGDGTTVYLLQVEGYVNETPGIFEYIINADGELTHQVFKKNAIIDGLVN